MIVNLQNVVKSYQQGATQVSILRGLNLSVNKGETVALLGQSGAGKSTLLSLMAGLDRPDSGRVEVCDINLSDLNENERAQFRKKHLAIVFQQFHLMSSLTALENIRLPLDLRHDPLADAKAHEALQLVSLSHRAQHLPHQLSGGECQRVAIARAFVAAPNLLLADEPSGNLDQATGEIIASILFDLVAKQKMTMILVTHNQELAQKCHRTLRLANGILS